jgi:hypothetical protein
MDKGRPYGFNSQMDYDLVWWRTDSNGRDHPWRFFGIVPTEGGQFLAPPVIIISLGLSLLFGGLAMWVPEQAPAILRSGILIIALASPAAVCN